MATCLWASIGQSLPNTVFSLRRRRGRECAERERLRQAGHSGPLGLRRDAKFCVSTSSLREIFFRIFFRDLEFDDLRVETQDPAFLRTEVIAAMIRCNHCGTNNLDGSEYCDECGTRLIPAEAPAPRQQYPPPAQFITQVAPPPPPSFTKENATPRPATPYTPPPPPPPAHPQPGHSSP